QGRRLDMVDADGTVREIKHISGPLSKRDLDQLRDLTNIISKEAQLADPRINRELGRPTVTAKKGVITFTDPHGAKANLDWIEETVVGNPRITVEVFDRSGMRH